MLKSWAVFGTIACGIVFVVTGIYFLRTAPDSWDNSATAYIEFPEWASYVYTGAFFIVCAIILEWLG